jgi:hypothetical protein
MALAAGTSETKGYMRKWATSPLACMVSGFCRRYLPSAKMPAARRNTIQALPQPSSGVTLGCCAAGQLNSKRDGVCNTDLSRDPGKVGELLARFREPTIKLFDRHGMKSVAYWTPMDEPQKSDTLIYILQHPSREAAAANWKSFQDDPDWKSVKEKSEMNGKLTDKIDSTYLVLTDFSPMLR